MDTLDKGKNKLGEICDILRKETLEPAQKEAKQIIESSKKEGDKIIERAMLEARQLVEEAQSKIAQEKKLFESSMDLASKQTFNQLQHMVFEQLFNQGLSDLSSSILRQGDVMAKLVATIINTLEKEGLNGNVSLALAKEINPSEVSKYLVATAIEKVKNGGVKIDTLAEGARVEIKDKKMTIDVSPQSLKDLMGNFLRDSFKQILFKNV